MNVSGGPWRRLTGNGLGETMNTLLQILLYLWIAITAMLLVTWYLRRRTAVDVPSPALDVANTHPRAAVGASVGDHRAGKASGEPDSTDLKGSDEAESERSKPRQAMHPALLGTAGQAPWSTDPVYPTPIEGGGNDCADLDDGNIPAEADHGYADTEETGRETATDYADTTDDTPTDDADPDHTETVDDAFTDTTDDETDPDHTETVDDALTDDTNADADDEPEEFNAVTDDHYDRRRTLTEERVDSDEDSADGSGVALPDVHARVLTDMLDGIQLPYDLTPITSAVEDPDRHLIFLTTHSNAEEVGTRFADELIRLGYAFTPIGLDQAIATRGDDIVSMMIAPKADEVRNASGPRYGAAGPGDVALELWTGRSSTPPSTAR
jgi:hypothetical protein